MLARRHLQKRRLREQVIQSDAAMQRALAEVRRALAPSSLPCLVSNGLRARPDWFCGDSPGRALSRAIKSAVARQQVAFPSVSPFVDAFRAERNCLHGLAASSPGVNSPL